MIKKLGMLFTVLIIAVLAISCKKPSDLPSSDREEKFEDGATTINMWVNNFEEWQNNLNKELRFDFNENLTDGIQLKQTLVETNDFDDLIRTARATNKEPDIYMVSIGNVYKEVKNGYAADVSSLFNTWDDLYDNAKTAVTFNGKEYGYPIQMEPSTLLFYRKDLLKQYGKTDTIPTTWEGLLALCETIKTNIKSSNTKGVYAFDVPKGVACGWATWGMQIAATGGLALTDDWTTSRVGGEGKEGYTALANLWAKLFQNGYVPLSSGDYTDIIIDLCQGKLVMTTAGSWSVAEILTDYENLKDQIGVAQMPTFDGDTEKTTATNGGWVYIISDSCKNKEKAAEVIKFLIAGENTEEAMKYFRGAYYSKTSTRKSVQNQIIEELKTQDKVPSEWISMIATVSEKAWLEPIYSWDISVAVENLLENAALGNKISSEISAAESKIITIMQNDKLANANPRN